MANFAIDSMGNVTVTPAFRTIMNTWSGSGHDPENGAMEHMVGAVASTSGTTLVSR